MTTANDQPGISAGMESDPDRAAATEEGVGRPFATGGVVLGVAGDLSAPIKPMSDIDDDEKRAFLAEVERPGSTPEPDSGGPGWTREQIQGVWEDLEDASCPKNAAAVRALLADRDRLATGQASGAVVAHWSALLAKAEEERDAARAELDEVKAHRDQVLQFLGAAEDTRNLFLAQRNEWRDRAVEALADRDEARAEVDRLRGELERLHQRDGVLVVKADPEELETARRDGAADALKHAADTAASYGWADVKLTQLGEWARAVRTGERTIPVHADEVNEEPPQTTDQPTEGE